MPPDTDDRRGEPVPGGRERWRNPRRLFLLGAVSLLVLVAVVLLVGRAVGFARLADELRGAEPEWLALALVAESLSFVGYGVALREVARFEGGPRLSLGQSMYIVLASLGATRLVSTGGVAGLALDYWALSRTGAGKADAAARVLAPNVLFFGSLGLGAWLAALAFVLGGGGSAPPHAAVVWLIVVQLVFFSHSPTEPPAGGSLWDGSSAPGSTGCSRVSETPCPSCGV